MPPSRSFDTALRRINDRKDLYAVQSNYGGKSVVFEADDTLKWAAVGSRLVPAVYSADGKCKTPPDHTAKYNATEIVIPVRISRAFMGVKTLNDPDVSSSKATIYCLPIDGCPRSEQLFKQMKLLYSDDVYTKAVAGHQMHASKQGNFFKGGDVEKGMAALKRRGKLFFPFYADDDGKAYEFIARRKIFSTRKPYKPTGTDFDTDVIREFCQRTAGTVDSGMCSVDPIPTFYFTGRACTDIGSVRSSDASILVMKLGCDWVSTSNSNISFTNALEFVQLLHVNMSSANRVIKAPCLASDDEMDSDATVENEPTGPDLTDAAGDKRAAETESDEETDQPTGDMVSDFAAARRKLAKEK